MVLGTAHLLISYGRLHRTKCVLDFSSNELKSGAISIMISATPSGHIYLPMIPILSKEGPKDARTATNTPVECEVYPSEFAELTPVTLHRLHIHLGNAPPNATMRVLAQSKGSVEMSSLNRSIKECGCDQLKFGYQRLLVLSHRPLKRRSHVAIDVFHPVPSTGVQFPYLVTICMLSRFSMAAPSGAHKHSDVVGLSSAFGVRAWGPNPCDF